MKPLLFLTMAASLALAFPVAGQVSGPDDTGAFSVGGLTATTQNAEKPWSVTVEGDTLRFEARSGERRLKATERDRPIDRSELSFSRHPFAFGQLYAIHFEVLFEPGTANTAHAMKFFQVHNTNDPGDFASLGPILALQLDRELLRIVTRAVLGPVTSTFVDVKVMAGNFFASSHCGPRRSSRNPSGGWGIPSEAGSTVTSIVEVSGALGSKCSEASKVSKRPTYLEKLRWSARKISVECSGSSL